MVGISFLGASIVSPHTLVFTGGDSGSLCRQLAEATRLPVSCLVYDDKPIKPFTLKWQEAKDLRRLMKTVGKHQLENADDSLAIYRGGLPSIIIASDEQYLSTVKPFLAPDGVGANGRFTLTTSPKTALRLGSLNRMNFSKPIKIHWLYQRLGVAVSAKDATESQLLSSIARAIGAKFQNLPNEFRFDFDPDSYRARFLQSYANPVPVGYPQFEWGQRYSEAQSNLCVEAIKAISNKQLQQAFEKSNGSVTLDVPMRTPLHRAVLRKLDSVEELSQEQNPSFRQVADIYIVLLGRINLSSQPKVVFGPPAQVGAMFPSNDNPDSWIVL